MKQSLGVKSLVNAAVFTLLIVIFIWTGGMIGIIPWTMPAVPFIVSFLSSLPFVFYAARIDRFGMLTFTGIVLGVLFSLSHEGLTNLASWTVCAFIGDLIMKKGGYASAARARVAWTVVAFSILGTMWPFVAARDALAKHIIDSGYGQEYVAKLMAVTQPWVAVVAILFGAVGAWLGTTFGFKMLRRYKKMGRLS